MVSVDLEKSKEAFAVAIAVVLIGASVTSIGLIVQKAYAVGGTLDQTLCESVWEFGRLISVQ